MQDRFSPKQIRRRRRQKLIEILKRLGTSKAEKTAVKLQQFAGVLVTDIRINTFNEFLRELKYNTKASGFPSMSRGNMDG